MTRVGIGGFWHETNTFAPGLTTTREFREYQFAEGSDVVVKYGSTETEIGGAIRTAQQAGVEPVPLAYAAAVPSGLVSRQTFEELVELFVHHGGRAGCLDGIVLALHGAMLAEGHPDAETELVQALRDILGNIPIVVTLDLHGNLSPDLCKTADLVVSYDTFPHVDMAERGEEALRLLLRLISSERRLNSYYMKLPLLTVPQKQETTEEPMASIMNELHNLEADVAVWTASVLPGYPYSDGDRLGLSVYVAAENDSFARTRHLAEFIWARRHSFMPELADPLEAVERAGRLPGPVVLVDVADNVGGGSPGNGTVLLRALEQRGGRDGVVVIWDPACIEAIYSSKRDSGSLVVGAQASPALGGPVRLEAQIRRVGHITYQRTGAYMRGQATSMGRVAVLSSGTGKVVATECRVMPFDDDHLRVLGIEPEKFRIIVVKSAIAWKAAFGGLATHVFYLNTPGYCPSDLRLLHYATRPKPMFPLEWETTWTPT